MEEKKENNLVENQYWNLMKKPIVFASYTFALSSISAGVFYGVVYLMLKLCSFANANMCSPFLHLIHVPPSFFDGIICIIIFLYTFKFKERMPYFQIFKISFYFTFFIFIRMLIIWNFTTHSNLSFYLMLDIIGTILTLILTFLGNCIGLKIINVLCLKWLKKINEST